MVKDREKGSRLCLGVGKMSKAQKCRITSVGGHLQLLRPLQNNGEEDPYSEFMV